MNDDKKQTHPYILLEPAEGLCARAVALADELRAFFELVDEVEEDANPTFRVGADWTQWSHARRMAEYTEAVLRHVKHLVKRAERAKPGEAQ